jgi:hypothetical protein
MNKRIKELAEQAYELKQNMVIDPTTYEIVLGKTYSKELNQEKFAELIAQDVLKVIHEVGYKSSNDIPFSTTELFERMVKQHFGIES